MDQSIAGNPILAPAAILVAWTLFMLLWMLVTRLPAMKAAGISLNSNLPGTRRGVDLDPILPPNVGWKSHNHTHLHEQPTLFYAVVAILAINGGYTLLDVRLAWAYVAFRVAHSLVQAVVNYVPLRVVMFGGSVFCLLPLTVSAVRLTL